MPAMGHHPQSGYGQMHMMDMGPPSHPGFDTLGPDPSMMHMGGPGPGGRALPPLQRMVPQPQQAMMHDPMAAMAHMGGGGPPSQHDQMNSWFDGPDM